MIDLKVYSVIHAIESDYSCKSYKQSFIGEVKSQLLEYMDNIQAVENETDP